MSEGREKSKSASTSPASRRMLQDGPLKMHLYLVREEEDQNGIMLPNSPRGGRKTEILCLIRKGQRLSNLLVKIIIGVFIFLIIM